MKDLSSESKHALASEVYKQPHLMELVDDAYILYIMIAKRYKFSDEQWRCLTEVIICRERMAAKFYKACIEEVESLEDLTAMAYDIFEDITYPFISATDAKCLIDMLSARHAESYDKIE